MRILLAIHNAYTDSTSGAAHSMRIMMQWLAEGGHDWPNPFIQAHNTRFRERQK